LFVRIDSFIDDLNEMDETFTLSATATSGTIGTVTNGNGTILDATPILVVGSDDDDTGTTGPTHTVPNPVPGAPNQGAIIGGGGADILIGDPGGALFDDLNVAIILDISGSMVNPDNNPAPGVTRLDVVQDALVKILPQLANRDSVVNLFIETFSTDADEPLFIGELTTANVDEIIADILALDDEAGGFTNYEAPLTDMQDWYLDQIAATEGFSNVAYFLTDGFPNRWLDDDGNVAGTGGGFNSVALAEAIAAIPNVLDQDSGTLSGDDEVLLNAIGASNALESTLDLLDNTEVIDPGPPQVGEAQIVNLGDPSAVPDEFLVVGLGVGADEISGRDGDDIIFGDVPNSDALATAEGIDLPPGSGWFVFEALEAGQSPSSPDWDRSDTIAYLGDPANQPNLIGAGRGEGDTIDGGAGDDVIFGQGGDDSLTGGPGADTFVFTLAADEGDDEILDFSTAEGDLLSFVNVTDADSSGTLGIEDVVDSFVDGGGAGTIDTLVLASGTTIMITDVSGILTDLASLDANSLINGV
jgi:Ca2+-binding RTX toxin-like protein